jgi:hypothetical protein
MVINLELLPIKSHTECTVEDIGEGEREYEFNMSLEASCIFNLCSDRQIIVSEVNKNLT